MSINACTMDVSSVDTFCGARRAIVLNALIHRLRPPVPPSAGKASNGGWAKNRPPVQRPRWDQDEAPAYVPTELDHITVTVKLFGESASVTQKVENRLDLVTVTEVRVNQAPEIGVNIENFKVSHV